jgi:isocitrate dehydrogenase kinase/phosphatase
LTTPGLSVASTVARAFSEYLAATAAITDTVARCFTHRDWQGLQDQTAARLDAYASAVDAAMADIGDAGDDREVWEAARSAYADLTADLPCVEVAETFFNSLTRRYLTTVGVDATVEFAEPRPLPPATEADVRRHAATGGLEAALEAAVSAPQLAPTWHNLRRDVRLADAEIRRSLRLHGASAEVDEIELLTAPFYRGHSAYLVGRLRSGAIELPLGIAIHHTNRGLVIGAILTEVDDVAVLFSYTRAAFFVAGDRPSSLVAYLAAMLPGRTRDELYTAVGHRKHGKTELYRDLARHIAASEDRFDYARGIHGMVMIVFTAPGYDVVFKVIRDRFPWPKQTTRRQVMAKYRLVTRHDRAGRLVDAHEFERLRFDCDRFAPELLEELGTQANRSVTIDDRHVTLDHVYIERRLAPLDLYVREANPVKARAAIMDYGRAIKNLAAANVFPGDMLLKNFGVTSGGRVVFYDYDEIVPLTRCRFRRLPESDRPDEEMSAEPWFGVGDNDVFPEEFTRFLGIRGELRDAFYDQHGDLFGVRFWQRVQERIAAGEVIEIFPYSRSRRLGASVRHVSGARE